ncbi:MAG TPA: TolC family protein, partial [Casimicrobiaceae bacterium]|nr:TolC family protein [Casimicrobiaceae bacterium]
MLSPLAARAAIRGTAVLATVAALCAGPALAQTPLTFEDAQRMAVERSRLVDAQDSAAAASREMAVAAGQLPDPVLSVGVTNVPVSGPDAFSLTRDPMTMKNVGVMQEWTRAEKRRARADRYEREADKAIAEKLATIASLERDTARAWLDRHYAEAQLAVIAEQTAQA